MNGFVFLDFVFSWCEQRKEYKITEKNNKAESSRKGNRWKCKEKEGWKNNRKE